MEIKPKLIPRPIHTLMVMLVLIAWFSLHASAFAPSAPDCHYNTWTWDTLKKRSVNHHRVAKLKSQLKPEEVDAQSGCTLCEEDQTRIKLGDLPPFAICKRFATDVRAALQRSLEAGFPITEVSAYRVGRSKGPVDEKGQRTQFSNHSFGVALDVNPRQNGLYANCFTFGPQCRLLRGGPWRPGVPGTVTRDSPVYGLFQNIGWKWGGQLAGRQKDFMHFSLSGD